MGQDNKTERLKLKPKKTSNQRSTSSKLNELSQKTLLENSANLKTLKHKVIKKKENQNKQNVNTTDKNRKRGAKEDESTNVKKRKLEENEIDKQQLTVKANGKKSKKGDEDGNMVDEGIKNEKEKLEQSRIYLTCKDPLIKKDQLQKEQRDKRCLLLKNLAASTTEDFLNKIAPRDVVDVRLMDMKSKKALGKKFVILEFPSEDTCKSNFNSIKSLMEKIDKEVVVDFVGGKKSSSAADMAFDQRGLFVSGFKPSTTKAEIRSLFPAAISIDGSFNKTHNGHVLDASNVAVSFSSSEECLKARTAIESSEEHKYLRISFIRAGKRRCRKEAVKGKRKNLKEQVAKKSKKDVETK